MANTQYVLTGGSGAVSNAQLDPSLLQYATVNISSAQLLALHGTPVALIAAPASGKAILLDSLLFEMTTTATGYTSGGPIVPVYHGATAGLLSPAIPASVVTASAGTSNTLLGIGSLQTNGLTISSATGVD